MKQTVKEAAKEFAKSVIDSFGRRGVPSGISDIKEMIALGFENGAEWKAKQMAWISVEERLPETKDEVLVLNRMKRSDKYFVSENCYTNGDWAAKSAMYYEEIAWMPIPSFDEILEANRDVLERIKEKGD